MNYIWKNYNTYKKFRIDFTRSSPYVETLNVENDTVFVNTAIRFDEFLFPTGFTEFDNDKFIDLLYNYMNDARYSDIASVLMHYMANLDRVKGIKSLDILRIFERNLILNLSYGEFTKTEFLKLSNKNQDIILTYLAKYDFDKQRENFFVYALYKIFDNMQIYYENDTNILHIYIAEIRSSENENMVKLLEFLFKCVSTKAEYMWLNEHFAVVDYENTMVIDSITIY